MDRWSSTCVRCELPPESLPSQLWVGVDRQISKDKTRFNFWSNLRHGAELSGALKNVCPDPHHEVTRHATRVQGLLESSYI